MKFQIGDVVKLRESFLRSTGQYTGDEPFKRWEVTSHDCKLCGSGQFVAVDEQSLFHEEKHPRHILTANLKLAFRIRQ